MQLRLTIELSAPIDDLEREYLQNPLSHPSSTACGHVRIQRSFFDLRVPDAGELRPPSYYRRHDSALISAMSSWSYRLPIAVPSVRPDGGGELPSQAGSQYARDSQSGRRNRAKTSMR